MPSRTLHPSQSSTGSCPGDRVEAGESGASGDQKKGAERTVRARRIHSVATSVWGWGAALPSDTAAMPRTSLFERVRDGELRPQHDPPVLDARPTLGPPPPPQLARRLEAYRDATAPLVVARERPLTDASVRLFSNDYLSLDRHPRVTSAIVAALESSGDSLWMSSVFFAGDTPHRQLEARLAAFLGTQDVLLTQSGYCANAGLVQAITGRNTQVYIDRYAHASLWQGALGAGSRLRRFRHNDVGALEQRIRAFGPGVVLVDSVYSQDGSICPLVELVEVASRGGCLIVVDESHALGTHGPMGEGLVPQLGLQERVHVRTASLAKAFITRAGLIAGSRELMTYLKYNSYPAIFSSALMDHDVAGLEAVLDLVAVAHDRRSRVRRNTAYLRTGLSQLGFDVSAGRAQIIALKGGPMRETIRLRRALEVQGVFGAGFCEPATPRNDSLLRLSINASLGQAELDRVLGACRDVASHTAGGG